MLCVAMKRSPTETHGRLDSTPVAVVADAVRRAWARIVERVNGERSLLEHAATYSGDLDSLLVRHAVRHGRSQDGYHRVFRAPDLVYDPPVRVQPVRGSRLAAVSFASAPRTGHDSSWPVTE
jgi:hypothetical protein